MTSIKYKPLMWVSTDNFSNIPMSTENIRKEKKDHTTAELEQMLKERKEIVEKPKRKASP
jgi:hypothetical protein